LEILHTCKKGRLLDTMEEFEIYRAVKKEPQNVLNEQRSFKSNIIYEAAIKLVERSPKQKLTPTNDKGGGTEREMVRT
jgi:hypothetical protein